MFLHVLDQYGEPVALDPRKVEGPLTDEGQNITRYIDGNTIVAIFPQEVGNVQIGVRELLRGAWYRGRIAFSGNRTYTLRLGKDLKLTKGEKP
jgi:hypothetical protein